MDKRELTKNWYLKKTFWGYKVMVEVIIERWDDPTYGNGGGSYAPKIKIYEKARNSDLIELGINCL